MRKEYYELPEGLEAMHTFRPVKVDEMRHVSVGLVQAVKVVRHAVEVVPLSLA